jgi:hypothetical protein
MIMAALSIFQAWILMRVGMGNFLNDLGVTDIFDTKLRVLGACSRLAGWLSVSLHYCSRLNAVME